MSGQKRARVPVLGDSDREDYLREQYHAIRNAHLAHPLPTLAERDEALRTDTQLEHMLKEMQKIEPVWGCKYSTHFCGPTYGLATDTILSHVAVLRRAGYCVTLHVDRDCDGASLELHNPGLQMGRCKKEAEGRWIKFSAKWNFGIQVSLPGTAPAQLARRGTLWCLPRLQAWARRARERANAPGGEGALRAAAEFAALADE